MVFALGLVVCAAATAHALRREPGGPAAALFTVAAAGAALATLVKGPLALMLAAVYLFLPALLRDVRPPHVGEVVLFGAAVAAAALLWVVPVWLRDGGAYLHDVVTQPDLQTWTIAATLDRLHWPWLYAATGFLPFTLLLPAAVADARRRGLRAAPAVALATLAVLAVIPKKRTHYSLPAFPFLALAVADAIVKNGDIPNFVGPAKSAVARKSGMSPFLGRALVALVGASLVATPVYFGLVLPWTTPESRSIHGRVAADLDRIPDDATIVGVGWITEAFAFVGRRDRVIEVDDEAKLAALVSSIDGPVAEVVPERGGRDWRIVYPAKP
jgi:hypothetical protein